MSASADSVLGWISVGFNLIAAVILIAALLPPFIDTVKSKKTYGIGEKFFVFYVGGGVFMLMNAILNLATNEYAKVEKIKEGGLFIMFILFVLVNSTSILLNSYIWLQKRQNMMNAKNLGICEREYWEKYLDKNKVSEEADCSCQVESKESDSDN